MTKRMKDERVGNTVENLNLFSSSLVHSTERAATSLPVWWSTRTATSRSAPTPTSCARRPSSRTLSSVSTRPTSPPTSPSTLQRPFRFQVHSQHWQYFSDHLDSWMSNWLVYLLTKIYQFLYSEIAELGEPVLHRLLAIPSKKGRKFSFPNLLLRQNGSK